MAAAAIPASVTLTCPRCWTLRSFDGIDGQLNYLCSGCEWLFTLGTKSPSGTINAATAAGAAAMSVASGAASYTAGMKVLVGVGTAAEVATVGGTIAGVASVNTPSTAPAAATVISTVTLPAGTYSAAWTVTLGTAAAAGDANNFGLYNAAVLVATSVNTATDAAFPQTAAGFTIGAGGATVTIQAIGQGTAGAVYSAVMTVTLAGIPVSPPLIKAHVTGAAIGQLSVAPLLSSVENVPATAY